MLVIGNCEVPMLKLDGIQLQPDKFCKSLGVYFDPDLNFKFHLQAKMKAAVIKLKHLYQFCVILTSEIKLRLISSLVIPLFDYCACVYVPNLSQADKHRIQVFQNSCLRFVYNVRKFDHISNYREVAKMDNIESRTEKMYLTLIHEILQTKTPRYLYDNLVPKFCNYSLRIRNLYILPSFKK